MSLCLAHNVCLHLLNHLCLLSPAESVPLGSFSRPRSPGPQPGISASLSVSIFCLRIFPHPYLFPSWSCVCLHLSICLCSVRLGEFLPVSHCLTLQSSSLCLSVSAPSLASVPPAPALMYVARPGLLLRSLTLGLTPQPHGCFLSLRGPSTSWEPASLRALIDKLWVPATLL